MMTNSEMLKSIIDRLDRIEVIMMAFMRSINNDLENMKGRWDELEPEIIKAINWFDQPIPNPFSKVVESDINKAMNDVLNNLAVRDDKIQN